MSKIVNTLILGFALFLGGNYLWATTYPSSAGGADVGTANTWTADQTYNDSVNLTLGSSGNVDLDFDGTDFVINSQVSGTGHVRLVSTSTSDTRGNALLNLESTTDANTLSLLGLYLDDATPVDNADIGLMVVSADDFGGSTWRIGNMQLRFLDVTDASMDTEFRWATMNNVSSANSGTISRLSSDGLWTDTSGAASKQYEGADSGRLWRAHSR